MSEPSKPAETPSWATNAGATISTPPGGKLATGWVAEKPPFQFWNWLHYWTWKWILYFTSKLDILPGANADVTLTLTAGGVITPSQGNHDLDTFAAAASQNLVNALTTNLNDGRLLILRPTNPAHVVTIKNAAGGVGQFHTYDGNDFTLNQSNLMITFKRIGADWYELCRSLLNANGGNFLVYSGTGTFAVPNGVASYRSRKWAGAGGGGGGGSSSDGSTDGANGGDGGDGGDSWVGDASKNARGGKGGTHGTKATHGGGAVAGSPGTNGAGRNPTFVSPNIQFGADPCGTVATAGTLTAGAVNGVGGNGAGTDKYPIPYRGSAVAGGAGGAASAAGAAGAAGTDNLGQPGCGGGGGGNADDNANTAGGGGGGAGAPGEYAEHIHTDAPGTVVTVTVGAGGTAGAQGAATGGGTRHGGAGGVGGKGLVIIEI